MEGSQPSAVPTPSQITALGIYFEATVGASHKMAMLRVCAVVYFVNPTELQ